METVNERVGRYLLFAMILSAGMWSASVGTSFSLSSFLFFLHYQILIFTFLFWNDQPSSRHRSPCTPPCSHLPTGSSRLPPLLRARSVPTAQRSSTLLVPLSGGHSALRSVSRLSLNNYSLARGRLCLLSSSIFGDPSDGIRCGRR